jgi:hypothetical protein
MADPTDNAEATGQSTAPQDAPLDVTTAILAACHSAVEATAAEITAILLPFAHKNALAFAPHPNLQDQYYWSISNLFDKGLLSIAHGDSVYIYSLTRKGRELLRDRIVQLEGKSETLRTIAEILAAARRDEQPIVNQNN